MPLKKLSTKKQQQSNNNNNLHRDTLNKCLNKLSDRDTFSTASSQLQFIAKSLKPSQLSFFISSITSTAHHHSSDQNSAYRRTCLRLITIIAQTHNNSLLPYVSSLLTAIVKNLRDCDSSVRNACVEAAFAVASNVDVKFEVLVKVFEEKVFTEREENARNCAALCFGAVIEGFRGDLDVLVLRKLVGRVEKLAKSGGFKGKSAVLGLMRCIVSVKGVLSDLNLIKSLVGFLGSEDWGTRKATAEVLITIAEMEKFRLGEWKGTCLKSFEAKKFDKVKAARETMNRMIELWREIPDLAEEVSPPPRSQGSSKENMSDGRYTPGSKNRSPLVNNGCKDGIAMFRKLDRRKSTDRKIEISTTGVQKIQLLKPETKRSLFNENFENPKLGAFKNSSRVVPCVDATVMVSNENEEICESPRELSLIRKQLSQIESQQSNLLDLFQRYIGSSQNSMNSLESRVHGLELALDEISYDLAISTGRMSPNNRATCCKLPGTDFLSSMFWRKASNRSSAAPALFETTTMASLPSLSNKTPETEGFRLQNRRKMFQGGGGLVMNPLARLPRASSQRFLEASSSGGVKNAA